MTTDRFARPCGPAWRRPLVAAATVALGYALPAPASALAQEVCPDGRISEIVISNESVFDMTDPRVADGRFSWAFRLANALHARTDRGVIERELLFEAGDCYEVDSLRDSERLLRQFGFIADAEIFGIREESGHVQVVVDTQDEWSTRAQPYVRADEGAVELIGLRAVEDNLLGTGQHISLFFDREDDEDVYGATYETPQFLSTRADFALTVAQTEVGTSAFQSAAYPFVGETGRFAWRQEIERRDRYFELFRAGEAGELARIWQPVRRDRVEFAFARRQGGARYRHLIFGTGIVGERVEYPGAAVFADSAALPPVGDDLFALPWKPLSALRLVGLIGRRDVEFVRRQGLDTVDGTEDVQLGYEGEVSIGPSLPWIGTESDVSASAGFDWAGEPAAGLLLGANLMAEGRLAWGEPAYQGPSDLLGEVRLWSYLRPSEESRHTLVGTVSVVGGWRETIPFQLTLGKDSGLRGYPRHLDPGGRRLVASLEHRAFVGWPFPDLLDVGTVLFADFGKIWPGDVPFGTESQLRGTVGAGLRAAFPPGSRQTFRVDVGVPILQQEGVGSFVLSIGVGQFIGRRTARRDPQLLRSTRFGLPAADFTPY